MSCRHRRRVASNCMSVFVVLPKLGDYFPLWCSDETCFASFMGNHLLRNTFPSKCVSHSAGRTFCVFRWVAWIPLPRICELAASEKHEDPEYGLHRGFDEGEKAAKLEVNGWHENELRFSS